MQSPKDWTNFLNMAACYVGLGAPDLASLTLDQAYRLNPRDPEVHYMAGEIRRDDREFRTAADSFMKALSLAPEHHGAAYGLADCFLNLGDLEKAADILNDLHRKRPESVRIIHGLSQLPENMRSIDILSAIQNVKQMTDESEEDFTSRLDFARGAALHDQGRYAEAWEILRKANTVEFRKHKSEYEASQLNRDGILKACRNAHPARPSSRMITFAEGAPISLFILGVSRSGKTTLERCLSTIDGAIPGYESHIVKEAVRRTSQKEGLPTIENPIHLPAHLADRFSEYYHSELRSRTNGARIFINTHPGLISSVGALMQTIPNSRLIFIERDIYDTAIRIYLKKYKKKNFYSYNINAIFKQIYWYNQMIKTWNEKFEKKSIIINYRDLFNDNKECAFKISELLRINLESINIDNASNDIGCGKYYTNFFDSEKE